MKIRPVSSVLDAVRAVRELVAAWNDRFGDDGPDGGGAGGGGGTIRGGAGVLVQVDAEGNIALSAAGGQPRQTPAKIVQVQGLAAGDDPANVLYKLRGLDEGWETAGFVKPYYGRPSADGEFRIIPARQGDDCIVVRGIDGAGARYARLWILSERLARRNCS